MPFFMEIGSGKKEFGWDHWSPFSVISRGQLESGMFVSSGRLSANWAPLTYIGTFLHSKCYPSPYFPNPLRALL